MNRKKGRFPVPRGKICMIAQVHEKEKKNENKRFWKTAAMLILVCGLAACTGKSSGQLEASESAGWPAKIGGNHFMPYRPDMVFTRAFTASKSLSSSNTMVFVISCTAGEDSGKD
jgi:hypothetical protein